MEDPSRRRSTWPSGSSGAGLSGEGEECAGKAHAWVCDHQQAPAGTPSLQTQKDLRLTATKAHSLTPGGASSQWSVRSSYTRMDGKD